MESSSNYSKAEMLITIMPGLSQKLVIIYTNLSL